MTGSKWVDHWTSGTVCECSEIAGSPQGYGFQTDIFTLESTWQYTIEYALQLEAELYTTQTQPRKCSICGTDRQVNLNKTTAYGRSQSGQDSVHVDRWGGIRPLCTGTIRIK
jgi:hypothetical protein